MILPNPASAVRSVPPPLRPTLRVSVGRWHRADQRQLTVSCSRPCSARRFASRLRSASALALDSAAAASSCSRSALRAIAPPPRRAHAQPAGARRPPQVTPWGGPLGSCEKAVDKAVEKAVEKAASLRQHTHRACALACCASSLSWPARSSAIDAANLAAAAAAAASWAATAALISSSRCSASCLAAPPPNRATPVARARINQPASHQRVGHQPGGQACCARVRARTS
jgi:hypothetical protein